MKRIAIFASILLFIVIFPSSAIARNNQLIDAIQHTQRAIRSVDSNDVTKHAQIAKSHANVAKIDNYNKQMDDGINSLDEAIKEGNSGNVEAAREAAKYALKYFLISKMLQPVS